MSDDDLIALLQGPSSVRDEFTAIHIQARDARLAADRIAALAEQVKRALDVLAEADRRIVWEGMGFGNDFADQVGDVIRALRGATDGAGG